MVLNRGGDHANSCDTLGAAEILGALASPHRLAIVRLLAEHDRDVSDLAANLGISMASTSHHLGRLRRAGLVISCRHGTHITNQLAALDVTQITGAACAVVRNRS